MLERHDAEARRRARALHRYMRALEQGDGDALGAVLRQAQEDSALEQLILALQDVYLEAEEMAVHPDDAAQARETIQMRARDDWNGRNQTGDVDADTAMVPHWQEQTRKRRTWEMDMHDTPDTANPDARDARDVSGAKETEVAPSLTAQTYAATATAIPRRSRAALLIQSIAAVLVVAVMVGSFYTLFSTHIVQRGNYTGNSAHPRISLTAGPLASGERVVLVATSESELVALRAQDGALVWRYATNTTYPVIAFAALDGVVYAATEYGAITALRIADGKLVWKHDFNQFEGLHLTIWALNGVVLMPMPYGVVALRARDGALLWRDTSGQVVSAGEGAVYVDSDGTTWNSSGTPIPSTTTTNPAHMHALKALSVTNGKPLWAYALPGSQEIAHTAYAANGVVYVNMSNTDSNGAGFDLTAFRASDGALIWTHEGAGTGEPIYASKSLVFTYGPGICAFRSDTGVTQWCTHSPNQCCAVVADENSVYFSRAVSSPIKSLLDPITSTLVVSAFSIGNGSQRWNWRSKPQQPAPQFNRSGASIGEVQSSITALDGVAYAGAPMGVYAIDGSGSGSHLLWHTLDQETVMTLLAARAG